MLFGPEPSEKQHRDGANGAHRCLVLLGEDDRHADLPASRGAGDFAAVVCILVCLPPSVAKFAVQCVRRVEFTVVCRLCKLVAIGAVDVQQFLLLEFPHLLEEDFVALEVIAPRQALEGGCVFRGLRHAAAQVPC